ncbi:MAG: SIS domain-containing protein [Treponema sp.]|jgi:tagatose-6-phosphate ketose/aldose isomerase|nr:SIS domain-containing protein [Treponema sp.]
MDAFEKFHGKNASFFASRNCSFTAAEIAWQPDVWRELCEILETERTRIADFFDRADISKRRVILSGAGSSAFVGEAASSIIGSRSRIPCAVVHTTDIVSSPYSFLFEDIPSLFVSFGRSGNSPESSGAVRYVRAIVKDLYETAVVCDGKSSLARITSESDKSLSLVLPEKTNDRGFAMTSSFTSMLLACFALFNHERIDEVTADIRRLADNLERDAVSLSESAERLAGEQYARLVVLGSGCCRGLAREAALKSLELSMGAVNAASESALGFRHGPKSVIRDDTLTIHFISNDPFTAKYDLDLLGEICSQKKGNRIVALSGTGGRNDGRAVSENQAPSELCERIAVPSLGYGPASDLFWGIHCLVFCQMLAMYKSISLNLPVDNPSVTGELSRVVRGFTVYDLEENRQALPYTDTPS